MIEEIKGKSIKLIDSSTIALCLAMFDWAKFRTAKGGIKIHTCWDDAMMVPDMVNISEAKLHDGKGLAQMVFDRDTVVVEDRAYFYFSLMAQSVAAENTFVPHIKDNSTTRKGRSTSPRGPIRTSSGTRSSSSAARGRRGDRYGQVEPPPGTCL